MKTAPTDLSIILESKVQNAVAQVWNSVVQAYEDAGLHKVQAYKHARQITTEVNRAILTELTKPTSIAHPPEKTP
jgi:hypothetical protein